MSVDKLVKVKKLRKYVHISIDFASAGCTLSDDGFRELRNLVLAYVFQKKKKCAAVHDRGSIRVLHGSQE
ncbi:MAG: hypothetical protein QXZ06_06990 [Candidatus Jordarchaeales archaeon]